MSTISDLTRACLTELNELISSDALAQSQNVVPLRAWKDELGRLRLWAGNIGAHQTGQSSLDYRLRDASHIKNQTVRILEAIRKLLAELQNSLSGETEDEEDDQLDEDLQSLVAELDLGNPSDSVLTVPEAHESLVNKVSQLFEISMTVRKPAQQDRLIGTKKGDSEPFKFNFHQHVSHKYPQAEKQLVDRISSAMARQRAILKYRERHHLKLSQGLHIDEDGDKLSETVASTFRLEAPGQISDDLMSNSDASFTSYAGSLLSGGEKLAIPALPKEAAGRKPFECPYCYFIITLKDRQAWARHIFRDLSPYICIFSGCSTQNKLYESRKAWYRHIRQTHMASQDVRGSYACLLCAEGSLPMVSFEKHVGRHLEELSLFVLPRDTEDDELLDDESGDGESEHGESEDGGQETESDAEREEDDDIAMTMNGITMSFAKESVGWKPINVRAGEAETTYLDIRPERDMPGDDLQSDDPDPTDRQDSHSIEPHQPAAQTTSRLESLDPGNFGNDKEFLTTVHAATKAARFDPDAVVLDSAEEPEPRGRRRSVGGSSNVGRHPRARERAGSSHAAPVSASPPRTRPLRQDLEILRQQVEIERLEREPSRHREEDYGITERLQRLERYENTQRLEEEKRKAERRSQLQRLEAAERKGAENEEMKRLRLEEAEEYQRAVEEEELREQLKKDLRTIREEEERRAKEREMKRAAVEEWKLAEIQRRKNRSNEFKERLRGEFGYTEDKIEEILRKRAEKDNEREESSETTKEDKGREEDEQQRRNTWIRVSPLKTTFHPTISNSHYLQVHRKYLLPETLMAYHLPWEWDKVSTVYN